MKNKKKIAICISGYYKFGEKAEETIKKIEAYADVYVFIHSWIIENLEKYLRPAYKSTILKESQSKPHNFILDKFSFAKHILLDNESEIESINNNAFRFSDLKPSGSATCMSYSIYQSNQLKNNYEKSHSFIFDTVIRMRFDSDLRSSVEFILDSPQDQINVPSHNVCPLSDQFAFGSSEVMNYYASIYNIFKNGDVYRGSNPITNPEKIFYSYLQKKDAPSFSIHSTEKLNVAINNS